MEIMNQFSAYKLVGGKLHPSSKKPNKVVKENRPTQPSVCVCVFAVCKCVFIVEV